MTWLNYKTSDHLVHFLRLKILTSMSTILHVIDRAWFVGLYGETVHGLNVIFYCCFTSTVNSNGHVEAVC